MIAYKWSFTVSINNITWLLIRIWIGDTHWTWTARYPRVILKGKLVEL